MPWQTTACILKTEVTRSVASKLQLEPKAVCILKKQGNTQRSLAELRHCGAICTLKTEVTHNRLHNNENKHHIRRSLTKGEQTFTRKDDILSKPAEKG